MKLLRLSFIHLLAFASVTALAASGAGARKKVTIEWKPIDGAKAYELEIARDRSVVKTVRVDETEYVRELPYGVYAYRLRGIDRFRRPGQWSAPQPLVVAPPAPVPRAPGDGAKVVLYDPGAPVRLQWKPAPGVAKYRVELEVDGKPYSNDVVAGTEARVEKAPAGAFKWKVVPVLEVATGRGPASLAGRRWEVSESETSEFAVERRELKAAVLVAPKGRIAPSKNGVVEFRWKEVEGAEAYEVRVRLQRQFRAPAAGGAGAGADAYSERRFVVEGRTRLRAPAPIEGTYVWEVRALVALDKTTRKPAAIGPAAQTEFELDRNALFGEGAGYVALSTMLAPYTYRVISPSVGKQGSAASSSFTMRVSGEYWLKPTWGLAVGVDNVFFQIGTGSGASRSLSARNFELHAKYRWNISNRRDGWILQPKLGPELRDYLHMTPDVLRDLSQSPTRMTALGLTVGFDVRKQLWQRVSVGMKVSYWLPFGFVNNSASLRADASFRNFSVGAQAFWWPFERWGLGAGGFLDNRSISFMPTNSSSSSAEQVFFDGVFFFGSLIYRLDK